MVRSVLLLLSTASYAHAWVNKTVTTWELPWFHPPIEWIAENKIGFAGYHPSLDDKSTFQAWIDENTNIRHRFFDDSNGYIQDPWRLPHKHPGLEEYFTYEEEPVEDYLQVYFKHPNLKEAYLGGEKMPQGHPSADHLLRKLLPSHHPNIDDLFDDNTRALPEWHIDISDLLSITPMHFSLFPGHPNLSTDYEMGDPVDNHPSIYFMFEKYLPEGHPNIDELMRTGFVLPSYHPEISSMTEPRELATSPASLLSYCVAAIVLVVLLVRNIRKLKRRTMTVPLPPEGLQGDHETTTGSFLDSDADEAVINGAIFNDNDSVEVEPKFDGAAPSLDQRRHHAMELNQKHHDDNLGSQENVHRNIIAYKEKKNTVLRTNWNSAFGRRIVKSDVSMGEAINCLLYVLINLFVLLASPTYSYDIGFGSLAAGNTLFLVVTATRNSVFTWLIRMTFDQALIYHRFIGRLTVVVSVIHSVMHYDRIINATSDKITVTGLIALSFGVVIFLTSLNYFRRKLFNVFFWSHFAFIGFIVCMYLHAAGARPFIWAAVACYGVDKLLGLVWTQLPRRTTKFEKVGERTAHVQFHKTPLMNLLGRYKVGQYVFVNFPELSLHEWHPFSVASAPSDACVDLYIRALGNHTKKIVEYSESCAEEDKQTLIRCDGPYGDLSFNYRRYGNLLLVGGGIGITPIISVLKDIFGDESGSNASKPRHCIKKVTLVWIMPRASEADLFLEMLNQFRLKSLEDPLAPELKLAIHITREDENCNNTQIVYSKPDFDTVMHQCVEDMSEFSRSVLVYACGPGSMVNQLWDVSMKKKLKKNDKRIRVDFYHESFEF